MNGGHGRERERERGGRGKEGWEGERMATVTKGKEV